MAFHILKNKPSAALYQREQVREFLVEKTALLGFVRWEEVMHTEKIGSKTELRVKTYIDPQKVIINGVEYVPLTTSTD